MHDIEFKDGRACIAWCGEQPYHKLGFEVDPDTTPAHMMAAAGVDWGVELHNTFAEIKIGDKTKRVKLPTKALLRDTDAMPLTVTGRGWHPIQNADAFDFFADFVKKGKLEMHTAGSLREGRLVWALAKGRGGFSLFKGKDKIETHVLFSNPHEYGKSAVVMVTPIRTVSSTTLAMPSRGSSTKLSSRITHRKKFKPEEVATLLAQFEESVSSYKAAAEYLSSKRLDPARFLDYLREVFPSKSSELSRQASIVTSVLETQPGASLGAGTWWSAYCAVAFTVDHLLGQQYKSEEDDVAMRDRRLYSAWFGYTARRKTLALDRALEYAKRAKEA